MKAHALTSWLGDLAHCWTKLQTLTQAWPLP